MAWLVVSAVYVLHQDIWFWRTARPLVFHGGEGAPLEMRLFAEDDLVNHLTAAGFAAVTIYREPVFKYGVYWPQPWSLPSPLLTSVRPKSDAVNSSTLFSMPMFVSADRK